MASKHQLGFKPDNRSGKNRRYMRVKFVPKSRETKMEGIDHKTISVNGINMHVAEMGEGPIVLLIHGFPQLWYAWRHQIVYLAANGYRAIAPDLRGYGDTTGVPVDDPSKFTSLHVVGDLVALIDTLGVDKVFVVGHDWGAMIAWDLCLFRPDKVKALVNLSIQFTPRDPRGTAVDSFRAAYGDDHYVCKFQEPGEIEAVFESFGTEKVLKKFLTHHDISPFYFPKGKPFGDAHDTPVIMPSWLSEEDIDYYTKKFDQTGFTGALNYYRCFRRVNGINMHVAEMGEGPIVLLIHGFPQLWYAWRHQIVYLAANGYRAIAPDLRGYGDTTGVPVDDLSKFTSLHVVGDLVALIDTLGAADKVFVVGHDWGAMIAWDLCLFRPDKVKALVNLSIQFTPRDPRGTALDTFRAVYGDDHYVSKFQEPGEIEAVFESFGTEKVLKKFLTHHDISPFYFPKGKPFGDENDTPVIMPCWLSEEDIDYYTKKFDQTGFTGALNYYRCFGRNWELEAPWTGAKISVPTKFIVGDLDLVYNMPGVKEYIHNGGFNYFVPLLEDVVVIEGAAHFIIEEVPDKINTHIHEFLKKF
ncbi:hypothetical protein OSB04_022582 [Centaurea solstitialis]|uniref:soluble epoxide hydrolase n=1 Tax=Centaurea solstitialis TaxID=347529 RepID=A0AA38WHE2_9ASTR|nr:hypothetical protein OSB04_022582 [Centaurea solstitialis]